MSEAFKTKVIVSGTHSFKVEWFYDEWHQAPWIENDGHGTIRTAYRRGYTRHETPPKEAGEVVIHEDRGNYWIYNFKAAIETAKRAGWGISDKARTELTVTLGRELTKGEIAVAAVKSDIKFCRGWLRDDWFYCGVVVTRLDDDGKETEDSDSLWGIEYGFGDLEYSEEVAREMADHLASEHDKEAAERDYWMHRDVSTT